MARTDKWEHPTDSWHDNHRMERKARPAGRILDLVEAELDADDEATLAAFEAQLANDDWWIDFEVSGGHLDENEDRWHWQDFEGLVSS